MRVYTPSGQKVCAFQNNGVFGLALASDYRTPNGKVENFCGGQKCKKIKRVGFRHCLFLAFVVDQDFLLVKQYF